MEALRVTGDDPARPPREWQGARPVGRADFRRSSEWLERELGRRLLHPLDRALRPRDAEPQAVLDTSCRLGDPERSSGTVVETEQRSGIVVDESIRDDVADVGADLRDLESGDVSHEVVSVRSDVAHDQRRSATDRVVTPGHRVGLGSVGVAFGRLAALHVLDLDELDRPEQTVGHHGSRLAHHRIARVVVGQAEDQPGLHSRVEHLDGFVERVGDRLVADDVEPVAQRVERVSVVAVVRGHDRDDVGAVGARGLGPEERFGRVVCAGRLDPDGNGGSARSLGVR